MKLTCGPNIFAAFETEDKVSWIKPPFVHHENNLINTCTTKAINYSAILFKTPSNHHILPATLLHLLNQAFINFPPPVFLFGLLLLQQTNGAEKQTESTTNAE